MSQPAKSTSLAPEVRWISWRGVVFIGHRARETEVYQTLRLANAAQHRHLLACLGDMGLDETRADDARAIVADTGALASVESLLRAEHASALEAIADLPQPAHAALTELADLAIQRHT